MRCSFDFEGRLVIEAENTVESVALQSLFGKEMEDGPLSQRMQTGDDSFGPQFARMTIKFKDKEA